MRHYVASVYAAGAKPVLLWERPGRTREEACSVAHDRVLYGSKIQKYLTRHKQVELPPRYIRPIGGMAVVIRCCDELHEWYECPHRYDAPAVKVVQDAVFSQVGHSLRPRMILTETDCAAKEKARASAVRLERMIWEVR